MPHARQYARILKTAKKCAWEETEETYAYIIEKQNHELYAFEGRVFLAALPLITRVMARGRHILHGPHSMG